jgi:hypothetical protein
MGCALERATREDRGEPVPGYVKSLAVTNSSVLAGGLFDRANGMSRRSLVALERSTGRPTHFHPFPPAPAVVQEWVDAIAVRGRMAYVGGYFERIGGRARNGLAALDLPTGLAKTWNPKASYNLGASVYAIAVSAGAVYVGGRFSRVGGKARSSLAALDPRTGRALPWNPRRGQPVTASAADVTVIRRARGIVYVGGLFTRLEGRKRGSLGAFNAQTGALTPWAPSFAAGNGEVGALDVAGANIAVTLGVCRLTRC